MFFKVLKRQHLQNQAIYEWYTDDNKSKCCSNPKDIFKSGKQIYLNLYIKETTSKSATNDFLSKIAKRKKIFNEQFNLCETKTSLDEII